MAGDLLCLPGSPRLHIKKCPKIVLFNGDLLCTFSHVPHYTAKHGAHGLGMGTEMTLKHCVASCHPLRGQSHHYLFLLPRALGAGEVDRTRPPLNSEKSRGGGLVCVGGSMFSWKVQTLKSDPLTSREILHTSGPQFPFCRVRVTVRIGVVVEQSAWHTEVPQ